MGELNLLVVDDSALRAKIWLPVADWQQVKTDSPVSLEVDGTRKKAESIAVARAVEAARQKDFPRARWSLEAAERFDPGRPETTFATRFAARLACASRSTAAASGFSLVAACLSARRGTADQPARRRDRRGC